MFGLLNLNKPSGITSRRVVDRVQRLVRPDKVGHAGTLDPLACGVLVVGIGQATRLVEYVQEMPKHYSATFLLGRTSTTEDVEGRVTELAGARPPARAELERAVRELTGQIEQRPPSFSALKIAGQRAYDLARAGDEVELAPR
jgi:tRNA pseudouridine55 synthase